MRSSKRKLKVNISNVKITSSGSVIDYNLELSPDIDL